MARAINRLSAVKVSKTTEKGLHPDGGGLYLQVSKSGAKSWIYRYMLNGKSRDMGLGSAAVFSLAEARGKVAEYRKLLADGLDPIHVRLRTRKEAALAAAKAVTFQDCADRYIEAHSSKWKNAKHVYQWTATLRDVAGPVIGSLAVQDVDTALVMKVLEPIWKKTPETASRLRGRIEAVIDWATVHEFRPQTPNPARWKGHLDHLLPAMPKSQRVQHQPAMPYAELPSFIMELSNRRRCATIVALELTILTVCRTNEILGAKRSEIDRQKRVWTIPAERMKAGVEHRVPLTDRMIELFDEMEIGAGKNPYVFRGRGGKPMTNMVMLMLLRRMGRNDITVHGFRSSFRDWIRECTDYSRELAEAALAHTIVNKVEAAYARGDMIEKRRQLMDAWGAYCAGSPPAEAR